MAKGFTVKAKSPVVKKEPDFDYDKAREMVKGKRKTIISVNVNFDFVDQRMIIIDK